MGFQVRLGEVTFVEERLRLGKIGFRVRLGEEASGLYKIEAFCPFSPENFNQTKTKTNQPSKLDLN